MKSQKIIIFGGTGFLGLSLAAHLEKAGNKVILVARHRVETEHELRLWDGHSVGAWSSELEDTHVIINLAGRSVDCIKTPDNCDLILRSRVDSVDVIGKALKRIKKQPDLWIQMSTAHIYGDPPTRECTEQSPTGLGLAPDVGRAWERAFEASLPQGVRGVILRTGFVLGSRGGAFKSLSRLVRLGLGGTVGNGQQGMSWIHQTDFNRIVSWAIENGSVQGSFNVTAPQPVSNKSFMRTLRQSLGMPFGLPSPAFMVRFGAHYLFKTDAELALYGRYVKPERLLAEGFSFEFGRLDVALRGV